MGLFDFLKRKEKNEEPARNAPDLLAVKLFFIEEPQFNDEEIYIALKKRFGNFELAESKNSMDSSRHYFFKDYESEFKEGKMPAQATIFRPDSDGIEMDELEKSFRQSWSWGEAESVVRNCNYELLLTDLMSRNLDCKLRLEYFQRFVTSIAEAMKPDAIWISNGEKVMNPVEYLSGFVNQDYQLLNGFINVRLFNLQEANGGMIMDTLGLHSLGLPDFEIKFKSYDPSEIAGLLFNYGSYIYDNGVVIENGNTIQGIEEHQKWKCSYKESAIGPQRIVIDIENGD